MGMDVHGKEPTAPEGEYFRRNAWGWRPLASMLTEMFPDLTAGCKYWQSNDGDGLNASQSVALADAIDAALKDGRVAAYVASRDGRLAQVKDEDCKFCNGCDGKGQIRPAETWYSLDEADAAEFSAFIRASGGFEIS